MSFLCFCSFKLKVYLQNHIKVSYFTKHLFGKCYSDRKVQLLQTRLEVQLHVCQPSIHIKYMHFITQKTHPDFQTLAMMRYWEIMTPYTRVCRKPTLICFLRLITKKMTFRKCWRLWLTLSIAGAMQTFIERTGTCFSGLWKPTQAVLANIYALLPAWTGFLSVLSGAPLSKCYHYSQFKKMNIKVRQNKFLGPVESARLQDLQSDSPCHSASTPAPPHWLRHTLKAVYVSGAAAAVFPDPPVLFTDHPVSFRNNRCYRYLGSGYSTCK